MKSADKPYALLAHTLVSARDASSFQTQAELAARLGVRQQSVSRWEAGTHRPRPTQLAALATLLNLKAGDLLVLANYEQPTAQSLAAPLPVDRLDPTSFELFVADLAQCLYPGADVRRAGGQGHKQGGTDVIVDLRDGRRLDLQCKRMGRFGPGEVTKAVRDYSRSADQKIIVLSRVASPQADDAVRQHAGWSIWDKDRLTRLFRLDIVPANQDMLVDTYFPGQRRALLGRDEPGAWLTAGRFFKPFSSRRNVISHEWRLVGRDRELAQVLSAISGDSPRVTLMVGVGGSGKSRLLREVASSLEQVEPATTLRFLDRDREATQADLEALGPGPKLIVVDDAHDRERLGPLFQFAADCAKQARVLVSTRPYALERFRQEAALYSVTDTAIVTLGVLEQSSHITLAEEVLSEYGGERSWAAEIVARESDSPLATVLFARMAGRDGTPPELARGTEDVAYLTAGKFTKILLGELGGGSDAGVNRGVLEILALVQPFHPEDPALLEILGRNKQIGIDRAGRTLRKLIEGGVVFRRNGRHRLMPDLLGDCLIEESCVNLTGGLTPLAKEVLRTKSSGLLCNALVNLGRLDWRRAAAVRPTASRLLDDIWRDFGTIKEQHDPRLQAVKAVAVFQPCQALDLVGTLVRRGYSFPVLADILRGVAHNLGYVAQAYDLLWKLGRDDHRELPPHPSHPVRIIVETGDYEANRKSERCEQLLAFALGLIDDSANWKGVHTPLTLLKSLLKLEGATTRSTARAMIFTPFYVDYLAVTPIREAIIDRVLALLNHEDVTVARRAAAFVAELLQSPRGIYNTAPPAALIELVRLEAVRTLERILNVILENLARPVLLELARVAAHQKRYGAGKVAELGASVLNRMPDDLEFRVLAALGGGSGIYLPNIEPRHWHTDEQIWLGGLVTEIRKAYSGAGHCRTFLEAGIRMLSCAGQDTSFSRLPALLLTDDRDLQCMVVEDALARPDSLTAVHVGTAMTLLMADTPSEARVLARRLVESGKDQLLYAAAASFGGLREPPLSQDIDLLRQLLREAPAVVAQAARTVASWPEATPGEKIELLVHARVDGNSELANELALNLCALTPSLIDYLEVGDARRLLASLESISDLDRHWINDLIASLSRRFPSETACFLMRRVEWACQSKSYDFRAVGSGLDGTPKLGFLETDSGMAIFNQVCAWILANWQDYIFRYTATQMFRAMFLHEINWVTEAFGRRLDNASAEEIEMIAAMLHNARPYFVFEHMSFVDRLIGRRAELDPEATDRVIDELISSAFSGLHTGTPGEPLPRDVSLRDKAEAVMQNLSRASASYPLYDAIRKTAIRNIEKSQAEAEDFDE